MFIKVEFHLSEPICRCKEQNIEWSTPASEDVYFRFKCRSCGVVLTQPKKGAGGTFKFIVPYPSQDPKKSEVRKDDDEDIVI